VTNLVRKALPADVAPLLDLIQQHAAFEQAIAHVNEGDIALVLDAPEPPTHLIVAEERGELAGYAALTFDYALWSASRFAYLDCLFVCASARGRGVGKLLFDHACRMVDEAGARRIEWQTPAWNADAIRFYQREGGIGKIKMRFSKNLSM
jgi:GNAT superfamily N-acetyltransferase